VIDDIVAILEVVQRGASESDRNRESLPWHYQGTIIERSCRNRRRSNQIKNYSFTSCCIGLSSMKVLEGCNIIEINDMRTVATYRKYYE
jgi:hypothetical protein